ncbi:2-dehydro-3-deoxy-6-phosphogalactonate aldolase [Dongia deserti]|uniref:2-dehydro-3-deoxy-6-phosphogalactonate aldolase n=1 Tax=Dongia deserti TaxID=2268030 RepID=UPI000E64AD73|nr:2-dehydro-3-deoxy-6-phosphogalactonate aldolase [Dongia deserti]
MTDILRSCLARLPLIAILRGMKPEEAPWVLETLLATGFQIIEVPLNSPRRFESLAYFVRHAGPDILIGAGTVLSEAEADEVAATGARLMIAPNCAPPVIAAAKARGLITLPGVATPTEAFTALAAGADGLKMFPGELLPPTAVKAWRAVLPKDTLLIPTGGVTPDNIAAYRAAGADGFGIGSALYKPGTSREELAQRAAAFVSALR